MTFWLGFRNATALALALWLAIGASLYGAF